MQNRETIDFPSSYVKGWGCALNMSMSRKYTICDGLPFVLCKGWWYAFDMSMAPQYKICDVIRLLRCIPLLHVLFIAINV